MAHPSSPPVTANAGLDRRQAGATLLEVLVTITILSVGMLGLAGIQAMGLKSNYSAFLHAQAAQFAYDMTDRMRANRDAARTGLYNLLLTDAAPGGATVADVDRVQWLADLATLPAGDGSINVANDVVTITVQWDDRRAGGSQTEQIQFVTRL